MKKIQESILEYGEKVFSDAWKYGRILDLCASRQQDYYFVLLCASLEGLWCKYLQDWRILKEGVLGLSFFCKNTWKISLPVEGFFIPLQKEIKNRYSHDRNHCKEQFRVTPQDRYELRADTLGCYPMRNNIGCQPLGGDSRNGHHRRSRPSNTSGKCRP